MNGRLYSSCLSSVARHSVPQCHREARAPGGVRDGSGGVRSHSDAWVGWMVWSTTVEVDLVAQTGPEPLDDPGGVWTERTMQRAEALADARRLAASQATE